MILVKRPGASGNCHLPATTWALELCGSFSPLGHYGNPISPPLCTRDSDTLSGDLFYSEALGLLRSPNDSFYLSAEADGFAPLVVDDAVDMDGSSTGLGPYGVQPGVPPFKLGVPIEENLVPLPAHDVTDLVPLGQNSVLFQFLDTQGEIYGNTPLYLVRDCGIYLEKGVSTTLNWVSHDVEINGLQSDLNVATGLLSEFLADQDFSRACILGSFIDTTQAEDTRPDPPVGDGYYYLVSGTCAKPIGYGDSSAGPRKGLPPAAPCP
jgi:hypothetical protein